MSVFFVFVDGIGLGAPGAHNPFSVQAFQGLRRLSNGQDWTAEALPVVTEKAVFKPVDATLGLEGLPQSGTGQVTLFTGANAAAIAGRHWGPYPHSATKETLLKQSFFKTLLDYGKKPFFINAYPQRFFDFSEKSGRWSTSSLMVKQCGLPLNSLAEVLAGEAVTAELLQDYWKEKLGLGVPDVTANDVAGRISRAMERYDVVFLEYYLTDKAGHEQQMNPALEAIRRIDAVLDAWLPLRRENETLVLCSDHGNVEDLSVKTHTMNPVPLAVEGPGAMFFQEAESLMDVAPGLTKAAGVR
jgi:hypothetical protein